MVTVLSKLDFLISHYIHYKIFEIFFQAQSQDILRKNEQKYYMFGFTNKKRESRNLDPGMFANANLSGGSISTSNNIIPYFTENTNFYHNYWINEGTITLKTQ